SGCLSFMSRNARPMPWSTWQPSRPSEKPAPQKIPACRAAARRHAKELDSLVMDRLGRHCLLLLLRFVWAALGFHHDDFGPSDARRFLEPLLVPMRARHPRRRLADA